MTGVRIPKRSRKNVKTRLKKVNPQKKQKKVMTTSGKQKYSKPVFEKVLIERDTMNCIGPANPIKNLTNDFDGSWGILLDAIDSHLKIASVAKANLFITDVDVTGATTKPSIQFSHVRSLWILICQWALFHRGCITSTNANLATFVPPTKKLPVGVAKILQQFFPYTDPATGSRYRSTMAAYPSTSVYWDYPSVDLTSATGGTLLSDPRNFVLSHPLNVQGGTSLTDYATETTTKSGADLGTTSDVYTQVLAMENAEVTLIDSLYPSVSIDKMHEFAPDASLYSVVSTRAVTNPCPNFCASMSVLLSSSASIADEDSPHPFSQPFPVVRVEVDIGSAHLDGSSYDERRLMMLNLYSYLTSHSKSFDDRPWPFLLAESPFKLVRNLGIIGTKLDPNLIGDAIAQLYPIIVNLVSAPTASIRRYWAFAMMCWGAVMRRCHKFDVVFDAAGKTGGSYENRYNGYTADAMFDKILVPATIRSMMTGLGPVVINGTVYMPHFQQDVGSMMNAISNTGVWEPIQDESSPATIGKGSSQFNGTKTITWNDGSPITYNSAYNYGKLSFSLTRFIAGIYQEIKEIPYAQGLAPPLEPLGDPNIILCPVMIEREKSLSVASQTQVNGWYPGWNYNRVGATPRICMPEGSFNIAVCFGVVSTLTNTTIAYPCRMAVQLQAYQTFFLTQIDITGTAGSTQFVATRQAFMETEQNLANARKPKTTKEGVSGPKRTDARTKAVSDVVVDAANRLAQPAKKHSHHKNFGDILGSIVKGGLELATDPSLSNILKMSHQLVTGVSFVGHNVAHHVPDLLKVIKDPLQAVPRLTKAVARAI